MQTKEKAKDGMKVYEIGYILVPTIPSEHVAKEVEEIRKVLDAHKVIHVSDEFPKERALTYTMLKVVGPKRSKFDTGYFGWMKFQATPEAIKEIKKALDLSEKILRFLLIETVIESTLYGHKFAKDQKVVKSRDAKEGTGEEVKVEVKEAVAEDLDKSIDKLVIE